jgi:hypothetical protein
MEEQMNRQPLYSEDDKTPPKPKVEDQSHQPAKRIKEVARLAASSVETAKDPSKFQRAKD